MKKKTFLLLLLLTIVGTTTFTSCSSEDVVATQDSMEFVDSFLAKSSEQDVHFKIGYDVEDYNVVFDVYAENPYEITSEGFGLKGNVSPILSAMTDKNGSYDISRVISGGVKEVYIVSNSVGVPTLLRGTISNGVVEPKEVDMTSLFDAADEVSRSVWAFETLGDWDYIGRPDYAEKVKAFKIKGSELKELEKALPEHKQVNADYIAYDYIEMQNDAEVWISLVSAKSLFANALGYYSYEEGSSKENISEILAVPYASPCALKKGEYVQLKYKKDGKLYDKFPKGARIGFVLHRSAFFMGKVFNGTAQFYTNKAWNEDGKAHAAILSTKKGNVFIGFEDSKLIDNDCNDVIFHVASKPANAFSVEAETPEVDFDSATEETHVIQDLSMVINVKNPKFKNLLVTSVSTMSVDAASETVTGTNDVLYIGNARAMSDYVSTTYSTTESKRKVIVRTTVKFARSLANEESANKTEEKKGRTVVRTTVKMTSWDEGTSRAIWNYAHMIDVETALNEVLEKYSKNLSRGEILEVTIALDFEGVPYKNFVESISIPPYAPFIEHVN